MSAEIAFPLKIRQLLQSNTVMSLKQIRHELSNRPRSSLFRDLTKLDLITSYSHAGQYHALQSAAQFDTHGLWFFEDAGFAKHGTLKNTLIELISNAPTGMTQKELKNLLRVKVQNTLTTLVKSDAVGRQRLPDHIYVYLSIDKQTAEAQLQRRLALYESLPNLSLPPDNIIIEILLALIRVPSGPTDTNELGLHLRKRGFAIKDSDIVYVLTYYDIQKKPI